jgi:mono/diheme cytochrome c family protein/uncharacterized protein YjiS (DUF1127 family)
MTDVTLRPSSATLDFSRVAAPLARSLRQASMARSTRRALDGLPDAVLKDIGLARSDIPFVAGALASGNKDVPGEAIGRLSWSVAERGTATRSLPHAVLRLATVAVVAISILVVASRVLLAQNASAPDAQIARGKYLVAVAGCNDCHTPGYFFGKPDMARFLGGSEVGFEIPGLGVFHGPNLTSDRETGLGNWSAEDIATAVTTGRRPDGRVLAPIMPWHAFAGLSGEDVRAVVAFLKHLPPVKNKVPGPFGPGEKPTSFVMKIVPPEAASTVSASE